MSFRHHIGIVSLWTALEKRTVPLLILFY